MGRFSINSGQIIELFPAKNEPLLGALVALDEVRYPANHTPTLLNHLIRGYAGLNASFKP